MDEWMEEWTIGLTDGWTGGWTNGWMNEWMEAIPYGKALISQRLIINGSQKHNS